MWSRRFRLRQYLRGSLWFVPLLGGLLGALLGPLDIEVEDSVDLPASWQYSQSTASTVLASIVGAAAALTGFVVTVSVLVVQMATGTFSARYMRLWYRDPMLKALLAILVGTLTFSFALLRSIESDFVPNLGVTVAGALVALSLLLFLLFLDRFLHRLRPVAVASLVARAGADSFAAAADAMAGPDAPTIVFTPYEASDEPALVVRSERAGAIQAIHAPGLVRLAREHDCLLVVRPVVGDFVPAGATLVEAYGGKAGAPGLGHRVNGHIALGIERTIEQDPAFAVRIMVDVAIRALSPAVNDPTTATQVLNHLGDLLRLIGSSRLDAARDDAGERRWVLVPARRWEDYLALGVTEIREYGASAIQVARRLRAMLEDLHGSVTPEHRPAVEDELARLDATVARSFRESPDADRAGTPDREGIGGPTAPRGTQM